jgi:hypothetical protein
MGAYQASETVKEAAGAPETLRVLHGNLR